MTACTRNGMENTRWFSALVFRNVLLHLFIRTAKVNTQSNLTCRPTMIILRNPSLKSTFIGTNWDDDPGRSPDDVYVDLYVTIPSRTMSSSLTTYSTCAEQEVDTVFLLAEYYMSQTPGSALASPCGSEIHVMGCSSVFDTAATYSQELNITTMFVLDRRTKLLKPLRHLLVLFLETYGLQTIAVICQENEPDYFVASLCYELSRDAAILERTITGDFFYLPRASSSDLTNQTRNATSRSEDRPTTCAKILSQALRTSNVLLLLFGPSDTEACLMAAASLGVTTNQYVIISLNASAEKNNISWGHIAVSSPLFVLNPESDPEELPAAEDLVYVSTRTVMSNFLFDIVQSVTFRAVRLKLETCGRPANKACKIVISSDASFQPTAVKRCATLDNSRKKTTDYSSFPADDTANDTTLTMMLTDGSTKRPSSRKANSTSSSRQLLNSNDLDHHGTSLSVFLPDGSTQLFAIVDPTQNETLLLLVSQESWDTMWPNNEFPPAYSVWHSNGTSTAVAADYSFLAPVIVMIALVAVGVAYVLYDRKFLKERDSMQEQENSSFVDDDLTKWQIRADELKELPSHSKSARSRSFVSSFSVSSATKAAKGSQIDATEVELYYGRKVWVKRRELAYYFIPESYHVEFLQKLKRLHHANFTHLFGIVLSGDPTVYEMKMVMEFCPKQSIYDLITQEHFDFTFALKAILIRDIVTAMTFLHSSFLNCHGSLKSPNCLVSDRFTVKITDYGLHMFPIYPPAISQDESLYHMLLWTAPEILRGAIIRIRKGSKEGDVYSFAIIMQEILTLTEPFYHPNSFLTPKDIVKKLIDRSTVPFRPPVPYDVIPPQLRALITSAWDEEPTQRPTFKVIGQKLSKMTDELPKNASYLAFVIEKMEQYSDQLEYRVAKASEGLIDEKKKSDELLAQMMPKTVLDRLRVGQIVEPEAFQQVTIGFTAVIDFAQFAFHSTPIEIVHFLNGLYTVFDDIIEHFDIYKVETIQDSYMVASGLPTRNGHEHAREVGTMALQMMHAVEKVQMPGGGATNMKIGLHSGGCAAGVIGVKAPRYCLFGDTINTASRMCTVGEGHKVVISEGMKTYLDIYFPDEFMVHFRNETEVKGKGKMKTYYLREKAGHVHGPSHHKT